MSSKYHRYPRLNRPSLSEENMKTIEDVEFLHWIRLEMHGCSICLPCLYRSKNHKNCEHFNFRGTYLDRWFDIFAMDTNRNSHQHVLRSFSNFSIDFHQIWAFKSFESKIVVIEIATILDSAIKFILISHDDLVSGFTNQWCPFSVCLRWFSNWCFHPIRFTDQSDQFENPPGFVQL